MTATHMMILLACGCVSLSSASMAEPQCHSNDRYHVVAQPYPDDAGNRFVVTRLDEASAPTGCVHDESKADFTIGTPGDPLWFSGLSGQYLILTRSTGPQGDLVVHDLAGPKVVLDVSADDFWLEGSILSYWQRDGQATPANCPSFKTNAADGLGSVISSLKLLDLDTGKTIESGEQRCDATQ